MAKRGRPPRAGERATERVELRLTLAELRAVRKLARVNGATTVADALRLALLDMAADAGEQPPVLLGRRLIDRIVAGSNSRRVV